MCVQCRSNSAALSAGVSASVSEQEHRPTKASVKLGRWECFVRKPTA